MHVRERITHNFSGKYQAHQRINVDQVPFVLDSKAKHPMCTTSLQTMFRSAHQMVPTSDLEHSNFLSMEVDASTNSLA